MKNLGFYGLAASASLLTAPLEAPSPSVQVIPPTASLGEAIGVWTSDDQLPFDGVKVSIVNDTSFDWWYFDAVAADGSAQIVINFYTAKLGTLGFPPIMDITTYVQFTTKFANGTIYEQVLPASGATITTVGDGSSGNFELSGASWTGSPSMSDYVVTINAPAVGVLGKLKLHKTVPSHYPCNLVEPGVSQELPGLPNIGWANAVPDSQATADFQVGDQLLKFYGYGYHDKNWGTRNLPNSVYSWYWGHLHIGPYSVVYFDILNSDLSEYTCGYLAKRARVLSKTCKKGLTVRPTGVNATFPPTGTSDEMTGFRLDFPTRYGHFWADLHGEFVWSPQLPRGGYTRFAGQITGGFKGQKTYTGAGVYEWIRWIE